MALKVTVNAGQHDRKDSPVSVRIGAAAASLDSPVLMPEQGGDSIPCQISSDGDGFRLCWILPELAAGSEQSYTLSEGDARPDPGVELNAQASGQIDVQIDGDLFTSFHHAEAWSRPFLHPVIGPYGDPITRAYPVIEDVPGETQDHPHHKSFWVAWGEVNDTDNWSENAERGHAKQIVMLLEEILPGPVFGRLSMKNDWVSEKGAKVLGEDRALVFWNLPKSGRAVDLVVTFKTTEGPVKFGDTKEGGICSIRVASSMDAKADGTIVNSYGGTNEAETWGKRAQWCDYVGPVNGKTVGITIFDHPDNLRYPTYWHVRNYGLMTANPFGLSHFLGDKTIDGGHRMEAGTSLTFRYRVYFHAGDTIEADVAGKYHDFINPPAVSIEE